MFDEAALREVWYGGKPPGLALRALAVLYGALSGARRGLYAAGALGSRTLAVPVIVVGNVAVGGTGKTPLTLALVDALRRRGYTPGVASRGFGGSAAGPRRVLAGDDPAEVGDEPLLIAEATGAPVAIARRRAEAGALLVAAGVDVVVADDGLQHYPLARNVEICVIDGERRFGNGRLLPAGPLREPPGRAVRADFRICNGGAPAPGETAMHLAGTTALALGGGETRPLSAFARAHAVAGIGHPERFFALLRAQGCEAIPHAFPDHHAFRAGELDFADGLPVLMTAKDAVKCRSFARPGWWSVPVRAELPETFFDEVVTALKKNRRSD